MNVLISWAILAFSVWATAALLPGVKVKGVMGALVVAAIFGILNWTIGYWLFALIGVGTLGVGFIVAFLTRWVVDAILLKCTSALTDKITLRSFGWAFLAAMFMSALGTLAQYGLMGRHAYHI